MKIARYRYNGVAEGGTVIEPSESDASSPFSLSPTAVRPHLTVTLPGRDRVLQIRTLSLLLSNSGIQILSDRALERVALPLDTLSSLMQCLIQERNLLER